MSNIYKKPNIFVAGLAGQSVFLKCAHFHEKGETVVCSDIHHEPGGKGINQAVAAKRLGASVTFAYAAGNDPDGDACEAFLAKEQIRSLCFRKSDAHTAYASILTDNTGENRVSVYAGASALLNSGDIASIEDEIKSCDMMLLQLEIPFDTTAALVRIAKKHSIPVLLNPAPAALLPADLLEDVFLITPNEHEYKTVKKTPAVVTLGSEGCMIIENNTKTHIPPLKVNAVDTTGAGDVFSGALAVRLAYGDSLADAARFAVAAAGQSVQHPYVMERIMTEETVKELIHNG